MKRKVYYGVDSIDKVHSLLKDARIGLVTNDTGVNRYLKPTIDILFEHYHLAALFAPEHGIRGNIQVGMNVHDSIDEQTGLPIYSLHEDGSTKLTPEERMNLVDLVVFDIQDSVLEEKFKSFVGPSAIAMRYGMTIGEYARYINTMESINCALTVVPCVNYTRDLYFDDTDLCFIKPAPNLPTIDSMLCYIGIIVMGNTCNLSDGRGTVLPFQMVGAPWLDPKAVIEEVERAHLEGVKLRPTYYTPDFMKYKGELCNGIHIHITDRDSFEPFKLGIYLLYAIRTRHPEFEHYLNQKYTVDHAIGTDAVRSEPFDPYIFLAQEEVKLAAYKESIRSFYLYE